MGEPVDEKKKVQLELEWANGSHTSPPYPTIQKASQAGNQIAKFTDDHKASEPFHPDFASSNPWVAKAASGGGGGGGGCAIL